MAQSFLAAIHQEYHPSLFFCLGLFGSLLTCLLALMFESRIRRPEFQLTDAAGSFFRYQKFSKELIEAPRHVDLVSNRIHELGDDEFHS